MMSPGRPGNLHPTPERVLLPNGLTAVEAEHAFSGETAEGSAYTLGTADTVWTLEFELDYVDAVRRVTREDMRHAARRHLRADRFTGAVIGPEAAGGGE